MSSFCNIFSDQLGRMNEVQGFTRYVKRKQDFFDLNKNIFLLIAKVSNCI